MIRQLLIGVISAAVTAAAMLLFQVSARPLPRGPRAVRTEPLGSFRPSPAATAPATRPASLLDRVLPELRLEKATLDKAAEELHRLTGASFRVDWRALEGAGIERTLQADLQTGSIAADRALTLFLRQLGGGHVKLDHVVDVDGAILISTPEQVMPMTISTRTYNVRDLVIDALEFGRSTAANDYVLTGPRSGYNGAYAFSGGFGSEERYVRDLADLIKETVDRESWIDNGGKTGSLKYLGGRLIITQTRAAHDEVEQLLGQLRNHP